MSYSWSPPTVVELPEAMTNYKIVEVGVDPMKIKVTLTVDVSGHRWYTAGGEAAYPVEVVREDVRRYIAESVKELTMIKDSGATVEQS